MSQATHLGEGRPHSSACGMRIKRARLAALRWPMDQNNWNEAPAIAEARARTGPHAHQRRVDRPLHLRTCRRAA
jgi:hypothetical protein